MSVVQPAGRRACLLVVGEVHRPAEVLPAVRATRVQRQLVHRQVVAATLLQGDAEAPGGVQLLPPAPAELVPLPHLVVALGPVVVEGGLQDAGQAAVVLVPLRADASDKKT